MPYRIRARSEDETLRIALSPGRNVIGSDASCEVCLTHPTVSRHHAALTIDGDTIELEDLGSRNGTLVRSRRVEHAVLEPGDIVVVGRVLLRLEEILEEDLEVGIAVQAPAAKAIAPSELRGTETTQFFNPLDRFSLDYLPQLLEHIDVGLGPARFAQRLGAALFDAIAPAAAVEVIEHGAERGVLFAAEHADLAINRPHWIESRAGIYEVRTLFPNESMGRHFRPIVKSAAMLLNLCDRPRGQEVVAASRPGLPAERPNPVSVVREVSRIYDQAERVARGDVGVLIYGESGTGKEVLARFVHGASLRGARPMVAINCASLPRDLLEAELFGVERGVATGVEARAGRFEQADQGTIFLDEIGDMAAETQAKILRVLQEHEVFRLGGHTPRPARARVIAATNRPIDRMLAEGTFRPDLYHRIATWEVELPPLRRRRADIPNLAAHFLSTSARAHRVRVPGISRAALRLLDQYHWPGNIRQLQNEIARAVLFLEDGELLDSERLSPTIRGARAVRAGSSLNEIVEAVERDEIIAALEACGGDTAVTAARLQISRPTLYRRIKSLGIDLGRGSGRGTA